MGKVITMEEYVKRMGIGNDPIPVNAKNDFAGERSFVEIPDTGAVIRDFVSDMKNFIA